MIKLPKKIVQTIQNELKTQDVTFIEDVYIHHIDKSLSVHLIMLRIKQSNFFTLVRYYGDNSYSICDQCTQEEMIEELKYQIEKLW